MLHLPEKMTTLERRATLSLASIMSLRLIGLFMVLPVFTLYAHQLKEATPALIGIAMGIYGLTQGLLQLPAGMLSDRYGRRPVILIGLIIFAVGSIVAAQADSITTMIIGRALQGTGAIGSTIIAMIADFTREEQRTKAMALNGMMIGFSFSFAMLLGPLLTSLMSVTGIFWLAALLSLIGMSLLYFAVPTPPPVARHADAEAEPTQLIDILKDPTLARFNLGIFLLHAIFTASFVIIPQSLQALLPSHQPHWKLYVPALLLALPASVILMIIAEKKRQIAKFFLLGILLIVAAELGWGVQPTQFFGYGLMLFLFLTGFSLLEAFLPSLVSRAVTPTRKGTALGVYSSAQFLGIFAGGALGGWLYGRLGIQNVYFILAALAIIWLIIASGMKNPQPTSHRTS